MADTLATAPTKPAPHGAVRRLPRALLNRAGREVIGWQETIRDLGAFALITFGAIVTKFGHARSLVRPMIRHEIYRCGIRLLPMICFIGVALGLVIIGQTVSLLTKVGAQNYGGMVMVSVVVRELGPLIAALLVLARAGAANVVELGTTRALGEVEALESLGIDPVHYLVMPRVVGMAVSIFGLTVYLIVVSILSGWLFAFLQDVPMSPGDYFGQLAGALFWQDFVLLALKTLSFGAVIAVITSFQGLARPLRLEDVPAATARAVGECVVVCGLLDAVFLVVYLLI